MTIKTKVSSTGVEFIAYDENGEEIRCANAKYYNDGSFTNPKKERYNLGAGSIVERKSVEAKIAVLQAMLDATQ